MPRATAGLTLMLAVALTTLAAGWSAAPATVRLAWAGDVVPASSDLGLPRDPAVLLAGVKADLSAADITFVNLEGTLTARGSSKCGASSTSCYAFRSPPRYARVLADAGIDVVNQANNHAFDFGAVGQRDTIAALDRAHVAHTGRPGEIAVVERAGVRVAFVGFSSYTWSAPLNSYSAVRTLVARARTRADVVVVALHGGAEGAAASHVPRGHERYLGEDRGDLRRFARVAIDAGASIVVGSGPHVVRGIEVYRGRLVVYSVGNFVGYGHVFNLAGPAGVSCILDVSFAADGTTLGARLIATRLNASGVAVRDAKGAAIRVMRALSRSDFAAGAARIAADGTITLP